MAGNNYTSGSTMVGDNNFNGGLNTTNGNLSLGNNESPDLQNIDFSNLGAIKKRNGYATLNSSALSGDPQGDGLYWYEYLDTGSIVRKAIKVSGGKLYKMDDLDGTWDDITGTLTITATYPATFATFLNEVYITNGNDLPFKWTGSGNGALMDVPSGLTKAKYVELFNNYLFLSNVTVSGIVEPSRIYWSDINDSSSWDTLSFIRIAKDDGQTITGMKVLSDRLVIYKERSIYNVFFTGERDIPFIVQKSNSPVGCVSNASIQEINNGHVFLSYDGIYFYDGNNSFKLSDKITTTLKGFNTSRFNKAVSMNQKSENRYWLALTSSGQSANDRVIVWDYDINAFSLYTGINAADMAIFYVDGTDDRPYFSDYAGFTYRADIGDNDNPLGVETAINAYYYTNWRSYDDLISQKAIPHVTVYYNNSNSVLTFAYSYDFETTDQYTRTINMSDGSDDVYGTGLYDTATYGGAGGGIQRLDLIGRGRLIRFKFGNSTVDETFTIYGLGQYPNLETSS